MRPTANMNITTDEWRRGRILNRTHGYQPENQTLRKVMHKLGVPASWSQRKFMQYAIKSR
jgi:hypothetical protein